MRALTIDQSACNVGRDGHFVRMEAHPPSKSSDSLGGKRICARRRLQCPRGEDAPGQGVAAGTHAKHQPDQHRQPHRRQVTPSADAGGRFQPNHGGGSAPTSVVRRMVWELGI